MNTRKILTYYGMFGCWTKFIPGVLGQVLFGLWLALVLFWMIVNAGGIVCYLLDKTRIGEAAKNMNIEEMRVWHVNNLLAICSYVVCYEIWVALAFALTSGLFMVITEREIKKVIEKESKKKK